MAWIKYKYIGSIYLSLVQGNLFSNSFSSKTLDKKNLEENNGHKY